MGGSPARIGARGPYDTTVTYTMQQKEDGQWQITRIVTNPEPPAWQQ
jgi:hypothetical protein